MKEHTEQLKKHTEQLNAIISSLKGNTELVIDKDKK